MSDDRAGMVAEIKIEHLGLRGMTMISSAAFEQRSARLAPDIMNAMHRRALVPAYPLQVALKIAA